MFQEIQKSLNAKIIPGKAEILARFFKTGKGQYGEGDIFIGVMVPDIRAVAKKYKDVDFVIIKKLLKSKIHEERLLALLILVEKLNKADEILKKKIFDFYLSQTKYVNNWDLVDLSCRFIVGDFLFTKNRQVLYKLAKSKNLWQRRIAIVSTYAFIRRNDLLDTFKIAKILLSDKEDLIHKAVGWMLREAGKKDENKLLCLLDKEAPNMPRTTLRYSIEKLTPTMRKRYLCVKM